ncbi:signal transduction histidine kinase [Actinoplanes tereljensis]|uniref:histidine kinase n=1 Tax=Paractinoplanes tereljensis TaxID=571912 RepID=A0A919NPI6_9ACTN|nr:HAMP domain-containing sensor histidine kinase [Actinoplanes tereljensis]GIF21958.1 two-component sensor histidine kinase [Actinoplanes tereljensis]
MGVRLRFTLLYGGLFLLSGLGLLAIVAAFSLNNTVSVPAGQQVADVQRAVADANAAHTRQLFAGVGVALVVMLLFALVMGRAAAGRVLRPLRRLTSATRRITADSLHERLAVTGPDDEVKALADTIDELLARLEESFAAQRRFVADASHELRTPLATIRATIDVAVAKPDPVAPSTVQLADRVRRSLDEADTLLEGLLVLARAQHGALDDRTSVSLTDLVVDALPSSLRVESDLGNEVLTRGNPVLLARLVGNVLDNAVRHNVPGGWVRVGVRREGDRARLTVESSGPVLDPGQVGRLGRPFQRLGADRTGAGTGLGLSIVAAVAAAHGGSVTLAAREQGGLRVDVELPA